MPLWTAAIALVVAQSSLQQPDGQNSFCKGIVIQKVKWAAGSLEVLQTLLIEANASDFKCMYTNSFAMLPAWSYNLGMHTFFFSAEFTTPESLCKSILKARQVDSSAFQATGHQRYNYGRLITQKPFYHYDSTGDFKLSQKDCPPCTSLAWGIQRPPCGGLRLGTCVLHQVNGVEIASQWWVKLCDVGSLFLDYLCRNAFWFFNDLRPRFGFHQIRSESWRPSKRIEILYASLMCPPSNEQLLFLF